MASTFDLSSPVIVFQSKQFKETEDILIQELGDEGDKKEDWKAFKNERYNLPPIPDPAFERKLLTQPAAIKVTSDFAKEVGAVKYFDAGDVQANGFQIVEDDSLHDTFT